MSGPVTDEERIRLLELELEAIRARVAGRARERFRVRASAPRKGRDRGCWVLRVTGPGIGKFGRRELTEIPHAPTTVRQAEGAALVRQARLNGEGLTLLEVMVRFSAARAEVSGSTRAGDRQALRRLQLGGFGHLKDPLTGSEILGLRDYLGEHYRASSARGVLGKLKTAWRWAHARDLVATAWPDLPRKRTERGDRCRKRAFSDQEVGDLLGHLAGLRNGPAYLRVGWALAETACRISELLALQVRDAVPREDDGADLQIGRRIPTKTGVPRVASISPPLAELLDLGRDPEAPLFPAVRDPRRPMNGSTFGGVVKKWVDSVGLEGLRDTHSFRRRGAVALHRAGVPVEVAKRVTGHESAQVFLSYAERGEYRLEKERRLLWVTPPESAPDQESGGEA